MSATCHATWYSPAKVNLCLCVVGRRDDGYHLLDSIFASVDLCDRLQIRVTDVRADQDTHVTVECDFPGVPNDTTNLAARAAIALLGACGLGARVAITIEKRIPPGAGLGGGSSNAATVLRCLNEALHLAVRPERLHALALQLGADVPFFLSGGCARVRGIGEDVEPVPGWPGLTLVVAMPPVNVSTAWAFGELRRDQWHHGDEAAQLARAAMPHPSLLVNDLEPVVFAAFPAVSTAKTGLLAAGAGAAVMSGSGAAVVGLVSTAEAGRAVAATFASRYPETRVFCVRILGAETPLSVDPAGLYA